MGQLTKSGLKILLDNLYTTYDSQFLHTDPLYIVKQYKDSRDRETAGFITASLSLGSVHAIKRVATSILSKMGPSPYNFLKSFSPENSDNMFSDISYRFYKPRDIYLLVLWTARMIQLRGSIENFFMDHFEEKDENIGPSLSRFINRIRSLETRPYYDKAPPPGKGAGHFLTDPINGSACKRINMFLRWMIRSDHLDLGIWKDVHSSKLVIPIDTHTAKISRYLGLTSLSTPSWKMAVDVTNTLKKFAPEDPVKYDFSLCRVGMLNKCTNGKDPDICNLCPIEKFCVIREK